MLLQSAGYAVVTARSAKEAIDRFLAGDFDLVLLCHSLPEKERDGLACLIRASGSLTPVITITSFGGHSDAFASATYECEPERLLAGIGDTIGRQHQKRVASLLAFTRTG